MTGKDSGLTLLELLVVITLIGIFSSVAMPYFNGILSQIRSYNAGHALRTALVLARSEAIKSNQDVRICPSTNGETCEHSPHWETGWIIYHPSPGKTELQPDNQIIQTSGKRQGVKIIKNGTESTVMFKPRGSIGLSRSFSVCTERNNLPLFRLVLFRTGRIRIDENEVNCA